MKTYFRVTTTPGHEKRVAEDLEDYLFRWDSEININDPHIGGVLIGYSKLPKDVLRGILMNVCIRHLHSIVIFDIFEKIHTFIQLYDILYKLLEEVVNKRQKMCILVKFRGVDASTRKKMLLLIKFLTNSFSFATLCTKKYVENINTILIEIIREYVGIKC